MFKALACGLITSICFAALTVVPAQAAEEAQPQSYIVLVGVNEYADPQIKPRTHAEADAKAFYDLFTNKDYLGVDASHIRLLLGKPDEGRKSQPATHENILKALNSAVSKARKEDLVVFGFFMQGAPLGERTCYFASDSTFKDRGKNALAASEIEHEMDKLKSQKFCAFVDVNYKGYDTAKNPGADFNLNNLFKEFLGKEDDGTHVGRTVFLANLGLKPSLEADKNGLFAKIVLEGLKGGADKFGNEPDGLIVVDELAEYLDKEGMPEIRKITKKKLDREQSFVVLFGLFGRDSHFTLTHNSAVMTEVKRRLAKLAELAKNDTITAKMAEEGQGLLSRMPKLESQRKLRKFYQQLTDGKMTAEDFVKERDQVLAGLKFSRDDAMNFAAKVIQATQQVREGYVKDIKQGELVAWAIRGLYQHAEEKVPQEFTQRIDKAKELKEEELTVLLADVRERLGNREDLSKNKDVDYALQRMLGHLDPYTTYIDSETLDRFKQETDATFKGIGVQIRKDTDRDMLKVVTPIKNSPAYKAGLKAGDVITQITREMDSEGQPLSPPEVISTKGLPLSDAVKKILGREKTRVRLTVDREGVSSPLEFDITRDVIETETVLGVKRRDDDTWDYVIDPTNRICYIRLTSFAQTTARDLVEVMMKLGRKGKGIKGLVLDLRFNPGGLLGSAVFVSEMFIDDGKIVSIRPRVGREQEYTKQTERSFTGFPMVCLVNGYSASGSEIVAACLQDHHRALILGERSYGKGSVQTIQNFETGKLKMTTASYWRPSGKNINRPSTGGKDDDEWGVSPDKGYSLKLSAKDRESLAEAQHDAEIIPRRDLPTKEVKKEFKDRQLDMALEYLRNQINLASKAVPKKAG